MNKNRHTNVWQKHAHKRMKKFTEILERWTANYSAQGVPCSRARQPWQGGELPRLQLSAHQSFCLAVSGDWTANPLVNGRPHSPLHHGQPKHRCKNVWQKHAYKCMTKSRKQTRIQIYEKKAKNVWIKKGLQMYEKKGLQMYEKKPHTNVWKKHAYKCMKKTCE